MTAAEVRANHETGAYHSEAWPGKRTDKHKHEVASSLNLHSSTYESAHESKVEKDDAKKPEEQVPKPANPGPKSKKQNISEASHQQSADSKNRQKLNEIKARTMFNMVDTVSSASVTSHLLFLTNQQATSLSERMDGQNIDKVLKAFEIDTDNIKLVINLLPDRGLSLMTYSTESGKLMDGSKHTGT